MTIASPMPNSWPLWLGGAILFVAVIVGVAFLISFALRRYLRGEEKPIDELATLKPRGDNPTAFMAASMQAVIQRLREQEKELEGLHKLQKERAQQTERLSEAVTRHMPAGLLLVNVTGLITSANPAAETALGLRALAYRRYTDALGPDSALARLLTACLEQAQTFRRKEIEYTTPAGELRQLGVTISPILHSPQKVSGALCLLSDLTELTALQKQIHLKENLAALGELSAGIAHEFKNALATISGYAQMIRSEAAGGELAEHAERILEQTRALTHVVTEFLKFARPLELADENVTIRPLLERVVAEVQEALPQVQVSYEGDFADVSGDEGLLRQALRASARASSNCTSTTPLPRSRWPALPCEMMWIALTPRSPASTSPIWLRPSAPADRETISICAPAGRDASTASISVCASGTAASTNTISRLRWMLCGVAPAAASTDAAIAGGLSTPTIAVGGA